MTTLADLLGKGYLPKELPTPFTSASYARSLSGIVPPSYLAGIQWRRLCTHQLARPGLSVRVLGIPDPVHFFRLASLVVADWSQLDAAISRSAISLTKPVDDATGVRALVPAPGVGRIEARAAHRARARFLIEIDVSQFYASVYTHALDWAVRGKAVGKASARTRTGLGPLLDIHTREANDGQTVGIPIGPDTSLVLGELVLAQVDQELIASGRPRRLHGFRYYDDYELYASSRTHADAALADIQRIFAAWQLTANPYKIAITELPKAIEDEWLSVLKRIAIRTHSSQERSDLNAVFDESFRLSRRFPRDPVIAYALGRFVTREGRERRRVQRANWPHFENLLLQGCLSEPGVLPQAAVLVNWARLRGWPIDRGTIAQALNTLIQESAARGQASEVCWAIWTAISLAIRLPKASGRAASTMLDDVVALTALHASSLV